MRGQFAMVKKINKPEPYIVKKRQRNLENMMRQRIGTVTTGGYGGMFRDDFD